MLGCGVVRGWRLDGAVKGMVQVGGNRNGDEESDCNTLDCDCAEVATGVLTVGMTAFILFQLYYVVPIDNTYYN